SSLALPPWSSTLSCRSAAMARSSSPPYSRTVAATANRTSEVSLARIWGLGARRAGKFTVVASIVRRYKAAPMTALIAMDKLLFWLGLGAAQKGAGSKEVKPSRHWVVSLLVGILIAVLIGVGAFLLLVSQQ